MNTPRPIRRLLETEVRSLNGLMEHARRLERLAREIRAALPHPLADHCRLANVRRGSLILQVDSAAWATRLRYQVPGLLKQFRKHASLAQVTDIKIRVTPPDSPKSIRPFRSARLSPSSAKMLMDTAEAITDPDLGAALRRLASRSRS